MYRTLKDMDLKGKRVLVRVDFNVPLDDKGKITDDTRIKAVLPTMKYLLKQNAKIILMSHLGRPEGKVDESSRMTACAKRLSVLLKQPVKKVDDCIGEDVKNAALALKGKGILMLENVRFHPEETSKDAAVREGFAKQLTAIADVFVNDAFGVSHREQASVTDCAKFLPSCAGLLLEKEFANIGDAIAGGKKPYYAIIGGAKADKIGVIKNMLKSVDKLIIGGVLANTFLKAKGIDIGKSKFDPETLAVANEILTLGGDKIMLPIDAVVAAELKEGVKTKVVPIVHVDADMMILDIGPETIKWYSGTLKEGKTIVWAGPLGAFEFKAFSNGTKKIAEVLAKSKAHTVVGGGDSVAAVEKFKLSKMMTHVSTGGGASLEMFEGKILPGQKALEDAYTRTG